jgi:hypothetical protein
MEFSVAMEEPHTRVVGYEAYRNSYTGIHDNNITSHGRGRGAVKTGPLRLVARTVDDLELMAVEMEWMSTGIVVVEIDLDDLPILENLGVDLAVDLGIHLICCWRC